MKNTIRNLHIYKKQQVTGRHKMFHFVKYSVKEIKILMVLFT